VRQGRPVRRRQGRPRRRDQRYLDQGRLEVSYTNNQGRAKLSPGYLLTQPAVPPPSTASTAPVIYAESSLARNKTLRATSSADPIRPSGRSAPSATMAARACPSWCASSSSIG